MKIIIAGGSGLIGTQLSNFLAEKGHHVDILTRSPDQEISAPDSIRLIKWDARTSSGWLAAAEKADAVINLAGENIAGKGFFPQPWSPERRSSILKSRVQVGEAITQTLKETKHKPAVLIQASAIGYYGSGHSDEKLTERSPAGSGFLPEVCEAWELSTKPVEDLGVRRAVCRLGIVLDPQGGALQRMILPYTYFLGGPYGNGEQWYSWIHIHDVIRAIYFLLTDHSASGVFNLTAPEPQKNRDFAHLLGKVLGRPSLVPVPGFILRTLFGEVSSVVLEGQRVYPERLQKHGFSFAHPELFPALKALLD
ncbi:MAG: TIGR01777 family oxidoreductase [Anaerolineales bacterium]|nr:TIGR01777 family oxidoreductase [Anaerolineales bacterium]